MARAATRPATRGRNGGGAGAATLAGGTPGQRHPAGYDRAERAFSTPKARPCRSADHAPPSYEVGAYQETAYSSIVISYELPFASVPAIFRQLICPCSKPLM